MERVVKIALLSLYSVQIILILATLISPLYVFSGGVEGHVSLIGYNIKYLDQEVHSGMLDYINSIAVASSSVLAFLVLSLILLLKDKVIESAASSLTALPFYGIAKGISNVISEETKLLTVRNISTTAGSIAFPQVNVTHGLAHAIISIFIPISLAHIIVILLTWSLTAKNLHQLIKAKEKGTRVYHE